MPINTLPTGDLPAIPGGPKTFRRISTADTNLAVILASPGEAIGIYAPNGNAAARYLKLYDKAVVPNLAVDVPVLTYALPPSFGNPINIQASLGQFKTGIAMAITGAAADNDATAIGAGDVVVDISFQ